MEAKIKHSLLQLTKSEIIARIKRCETFSALLNDGSLEIRINHYAPYVCTAIHAGHNLRQELQPLCILDENLRLREEDPHTDYFISHAPISLIAHDSRYEYDLNRAPAACVYDKAWGQRVWHKPLNKRQKTKSKQKHSNYYQILAALVDTLYQRYRQCLIFDVHSYNWQIREHLYPATFNIGTANIDAYYFKPLLSHFQQSLSEIELPRLEVTTAVNKVFAGTGFQAHFIKRRYAYRVPLIPLEIKKIYVNEFNGEQYPDIMNSLRHGLSKSIQQTAHFYQHGTKLA